MPPDFIQRITFKVDKGSAFFTFQVEMFPAFGIVFDILITGAFAFTEYIFSDFPLLREFFQMPVDRGLPDMFPHVDEMPRRLIDRNVPAAQRLKVIQNTFPLAGGIICRAAVFHDGYYNSPAFYCQYENECYFHFQAKKTEGRTSNFEIEVGNCARIKCTAFYSCTVPKDSQNAQGIEAEIPQTPRPIAARACVWMNQCGTA
jgi:hypothetical protein